MLDWIPGPDWISKHKDCDTDPGDGSPSENLVDSGTQEDIDVVFLVREFSAVSQRLGRPATPEDISEYSDYDPKDYRLHFESWQEVATQAGYEFESWNEE